jgi:hypothetical protein
MLQLLLLHRAIRMMQQMQQKAQRRGGMPLPPARQAEVSGRVGKPLPTSFNSGVSIEVVRRRLGHASTETTQVYALLADKVADAEIRAARRRRDKSAS